MIKDLSGKIITIASGRLSYEIADAKPEFVPILGELIQNKLGFRPVGLPAIGLSEVASEIKLEDIKLGLGWDNWSGAYVMAYCDRGDSHIKKIANVLGDEIEQPKYRKYAYI